jgi:hypothetical protein
LALLLAAAAAVAGLAAVEDQRFVQDFALEQASLVHCLSAFLRVLMIRRPLLLTGPRSRELAEPRSSLVANILKLLVDFEGCEAKRDPAFPQTFQ